MFARLSQVCPSQAARSLTTRKGLLVALPAGLEDAASVVLTLVVPITSESPNVATPLEVVAVPSGAA